MADAKIEVKVGEVSFHGEGSQEWLEKQLDKIIGKAEALLKLSQVHSIHKDKDNSSQQPKTGRNLAQFIKDYNLNKPMEIFLATAIWLTIEKGQDRMTPRAISQALKAANQKRLSNPSVFLKQNVNKGFCEMDGKNFFVTEQGKEQYS